MRHATAFIYRCKNCLAEWESGIKGGNLYQTEGALMKGETHQCGFTVSRIAFHDCAPGNHGISDLIRIEYDDDSD